MRTVVIGHGMAGARLAAELRTRDHDEVVVLGAEKHPAYNRILLSNLLAGKAREHDLTLREAAVEVRLGVDALAVDRAARVVATTAGPVPYDNLVLATGGQALLPPIKGLVRDDGSLPEKVASFRTLDDCRRILDLAGRARHALVLGGGLLGLEAARGLAGRGLAVTVLHAVGHLMERQLDPGASAVLVGTLRQLGVSVRLDATTVEVLPDGGVRLADGEVLDADMLVVACGVRPDVRLAAGAGLAVGRGVLVDDELRTSDPHVFAIGDCAEHAGQVYGLVAPAWDQARVVAEVLTGGGARYRGSRLVTRLKANGIDLAAMGAPDADGEALSFADPARGTYARLVVREDRLVGAIMLGDNPAVGTVIQLFDRDAPVPADRRSLLLGRAFGDSPQRAVSPALMPDSAAVCRCNNVTKGAIVRAYRAGERDIARATTATTGCGGCRDAVDGIVAWLTGLDGAA